MTLLSFVVSPVLALRTEGLRAAEKSAKLAAVRIGYVSRSILDMPFIIARDRGLFREEGLEPEVIFIKAAQTIPAMLAAASISARPRGPRWRPRSAASMSGSSSL